MFCSGASVWHWHSREDHVQRVRHSYSWWQSHHCGYRSRPLDIVLSGTLNMTCFPLCLMQLRAVSIEISGMMFLRSGVSVTFRPFHWNLWLVGADVGRIGVGICYDIQFPELAMLYAARGNQFMHITFQLALLQLTWLQWSDAGWMSKQHKVFPLSSVYVDQYCGWSGVHIKCYPGAFNMTTGPPHWELLQKARCSV